MKRIVLPVVALGLCAGAAGAASPVVSTAILSGNVAGQQSVERRVDGSVVARFEFTDRGRGPKVEAVYRLDPRGIPVAVTIDGNEYMKAAVAERFAVEGGRASWVNRGEKGEATGAAAAGAFYSSFDGAPEELALLASAILRTPEKRLALLPAGEATAVVLETRSVTGEDGSRAEIRLVELGGLGFAPSHLWLDADGGLFATVSAWFSIVRKGYEAQIEGLQKPQDERSKARLATLATTLPKRFPNGLVVRNARLFDSAAKRIRVGWSVLVVGDRIAAVAPDAEIVAPAGAEILDARGATLLPGLWDMHGHLGEGDGLLNVAAGVLGARDLANDPDTILELKRQWEAGETIGPRLVIAGFLDGPGPFAGPTKALASSFDEAKPWLDRYADWGFRQVKLYSSLKPELVAPIATYAHSKGMRVSGHIPAFMTAEQAVRAGYDEIQHANMLALNFLFDKVQDTRTPARFTAVAEHAHAIDLASPEVAAFLDLLSERGVVLDPTLSIFEGMFTAKPGEVSPDFAMVADRLPPTVRRGFLGGGIPIPDGAAERYRASFAKLQALVVAAWKRGVRVVPGTDSLVGFSLHRELELYAEAGIPNLDVLQIATLGSARLAGRSPEVGVVRPGWLADFILVDGKPDERMSDIRRVTKVVRGGALLDTGEIYRALGVVPAVAAETSTGGAR